MRQPARQACRRLARRPRFGMHRLAPPAIRSLRLSHDALRPAQLRTQQAARRRSRRRSRRQQHREPCCRRRAATRKPRNRAVARTRRLVGLHAGARLRRATLEPGQRARPVRRYDRPPRRVRLAVPRRRRCLLPGAVGAPAWCPASRRGRRRCRRGLLPAPG